jgi:hypothetical protein
MNVMPHLLGTTVTPKPHYDMNLLTGMVSVQTGMLRASIPATRAHPFSEVLVLILHE